MNEHKNIITIEDEIKEFSDKPVKSAALYKKVKELESRAVPDYSSASEGDVLTKGSSGIGWAAPSGGGGNGGPVGYAHVQFKTSTTIKANDITAVNGTNSQTTLKKNDGTSYTHTDNSRYAYVDDGGAFINKKAWWNSFYVSGGAFFGAIVSMESSDFSITGSQVIAKFLIFEV